MNLILKWKDHMQIMQIMTKSAFYIHVKMEFSQLPRYKLQCLTNHHQTHSAYVVVVISFPEEYNMIHSIHTTFQQFHKCILLVVAREALWLIELTTVVWSYTRACSFS